MSAVLYLIALLLALAGGASLAFGYDLMTTERGLALTISGAVAVSAAAVVLGLGMAAQRLGRIARLLESPDAAGLPVSPPQAFPSGQAMSTTTPVASFAGPERVVVVDEGESAPPPPRPAIQLDALTAEIEREIGIVAGQRQPARELPLMPSQDTLSPARDFEPLRPPPRVVDEPPPDARAMETPPPAVSPPEEERSPETPVDDVIPPAPEPEGTPSRQVIGSYAVGTNTYTMFADGSVEAITEEGVFQFGSLDELKSFVEKGATARV